jgi:integrase
MGDVVDRGSRDNPKWYMRYVDADGTRRMRLVRDARTKGDARKALAEAEGRVRRGLMGVPEAAAVGLPEDSAVKRCGPVMDTWIATLTNRDRQNDTTRYNRHLRPYWATRSLDDVQELSSVMTWIDQQRATPGRSEATIRHALGLLSRFLGWAIERGVAKTNSVAMIPRVRRPKVSPKAADRPWVRDDSVVIVLMKALPPPLDLMFYLGNRCGMRPGEVAGLRMADLAFLSEGTVRVAHSYGGPLKEDKGPRGTGKSKWVPAPDDAEQFLGVWLKRRRVEGAKDDDLVFPFVPPQRPSRKRSTGWTGYTRAFLRDAWQQARAKVLAENPDIDIPENIVWYEATRHSFVSRNLEAGASLDEVSSAVGHSNPKVTQDNYNHFVRKKFSGTLTAGLSTGRSGRRG